MREMLIIYAVLGILGEVYAGGSSTNYKGYWQFPVQFPPYPCIAFTGQIDLYLTYTDSTGKEEDAVVHVLPTSTVNEDLSSCNKVLYVGNQPILSQVLHINLDHYPGWNIRFAFTKDDRLKVHNQFVLYQVNVTADYPATKTTIKNAPDTVYNYVQPVDLTNLPDISNAVFAHLNTSYACTSEQKFWINKDSKQGPLASFKLTYLQVEAFKLSIPVTNKFDPAETCPRDQHATDMVPVIVGSCLAGLIVITLVTYLIYRCQLSREELELTSEHSEPHTDGAAGEHRIIHENKHHL